MPDAQGTMTGPWTIFVCPRCGIVKLDDDQMVVHERHCGGYFTAVEVTPLDESFTGLVGTARAILDRHYPKGVFDGRSLDSGAQFVTKLREALDCVHAAPDEERHGDALGIDWRDVPAVIEDAECRPWSGGDRRGPAAPGGDVVVTDSAQSTTSALEELREELANFGRYSETVARDTVGQSRLHWQERAEWAKRLSRVASDALRGDDVD